MRCRGTHIRLTEFLNYPLRHFGHAARLDGHVLVSKGALAHDSKASAAHLLRKLQLTVPDLVLLPL